MLLIFSKMHSLGNDFMVIDGVSQNVMLSTATIKMLADRHFGVGFDQLLLVEPSDDPKADFHYRVINSNGSQAEQCGNGARCIASFIYRKQLTSKRKLIASTASGNVTLNIINHSQVAVDMGKPKLAPQQIPFISPKQQDSYLIELQDQKINCGVVSVGCPFCVIQVEDLCAHHLLELAQEITVNDRFPKQVNIIFMEIISQQVIKLRSIEIGAGETLACGAGACAAVVVGQAQGLLTSKVTVEFLAGSLIVDHQLGKSIVMTGPTAHVYDGEITL